MRGTDRSGRITIADVVATSRTEGYARSHRHIWAVLSGETTSRPAPREISAAVRYLQRHREADLPDWF